MKDYNTNNIAEWASSVKAGDEITLSGIVYTMRDAAHKRVASLISEGKPPPVNMHGAVIYYAGPTPAKPGSLLPCGACGPTTSARMDPYTPAMLHAGVMGFIGKGEREAGLADAISRHGALYMCALGGAGALAAKHINSIEVMAFEELGCEAIHRLIFNKMPLFIGIDACGGNISR